MANLTDALRSLPDFPSRLSRAGVDMLTLSQVNQALRVQVHGSPRGLLLNQPYVQCERPPDAAWLASRPAGFASLVLRGLSRNGRPRPTEYRAVGQFLRHVRANAATVRAYQLDATMKPLMDRALPFEARNARWHGALLREERRVWADLGRDRPQPTTWMGQFLLQHAEAWPKRWQRFSIQPGLMLAGVAVQWLLPRGSEGRAAQFAFVVLGLAAGALLGCLFFVADPWLHRGFAQAAQAAREDERLHGVNCPSVRERIWPGLANPYAGRQDAALRFAYDKQMAIQEAVSAYRWQSRPAPVRPRSVGNPAGQTPYPALDEALVHELDARVVVRDFNDSVGPDTLANHFVRRLARWQRASEAHGFFGDLLSAMARTHRRNDAFASYPHGNDAP